jgi:hypothetical protein
LLEIFADPKSIFMQGLAKFERRTLYANIANARSAVYYTTSISKTDPFANLENVKLTYLPGYEDIILDPGASLGTSEQSPSAISERVLTTIRRFPFVFALIYYVPFGILTVLLNSGVEALKSNY